MLARRAWGKDPAVTSTTALLDDKEVISAAQAAIYYRVLLDGRNLLGSDPGNLRADFAVEFVILLGRAPAARWTLWQRELVMPIMMPRLAAWRPCCLRCAYAWLRMPCRPRDQEPFPRF